MPLKSRWLMPGERVHLKGLFALAITDVPSLTRSVNHYRSKLRAPPLQKSGKRVLDFG
jgi:hypothetical protein